MLLAELAVIDSRLRNSIETYESHFGETFVFGTASASTTTGGDNGGKGGSLQAPASYLTVMDTDAINMPERVHALGSVATDPVARAALQSSLDQGQQY